MPYNTKVLMDAIRTRIYNELDATDALDTEFGETDLVYPNQLYDPQAKKAYVKVFVQNTITDQVSLGAPNRNRIRSEGNVLFEVYIPIDSGDAYGYEIADAITAVFSRTDADGVTYRTPTVTPFGALADTHYHIRVSCPYRNDQIG